MKFKGLHIILATTLFAIGVWLYVSLNEHYQIQVSAPLVIRNLPSGKAIASPLPRAVKLTFNEFGWRLAKLVYGSELQWTIDLNTMPQHRVLTLKDFADQLGWRLGVLPIAMSPETLHVALDSISSKRIPIVPNFMLTFREGYGRVNETVISPDSVTVTGARSLLERLYMWQTEKKEFNEVRQTIDVVAAVGDSTNILSFEPNQVNVRITVQQFAEKVFNGIVIELVSVPPNREVILSSPKLDVVVRGGIEQLSAVTQKSFRAIVDYRDILADTTGIIQPNLNAPNGVQIVKRTPERLSYVMRKKY